jgi:polysaccharide export outer membrane protein
MKVFPFLRAFYLLLIIALAGCQSPGPQSEKSLTQGAKDMALATYSNAEGYRIGVDDEVHVSVWKNPDLSVKVPVRPDGNISVPLIGDVAVGGRMPTEVAKIIKQRLSVYLRDPQVTVILSKLQSHKYISRVRITGAVTKPVSIPFRQGMTVLDAVLEAGGVNKFASADGTKLYRKLGKKSEVKPIKLKRILKKGDLSTNWPLAPGDVITVPERAF